MPKKHNETETTERANREAADFDAAWRSRPEAVYNHWTAGRPANQIQLAFRRHWLLFKKLTKHAPNRRCLEAGCGRGSISSYFADDGFDATLLDTSHAVLSTARNIFANNGHAASFVCGDALKLPFPDATFGVVVSIGLLEHFEDVAPPLHEQIRVLAPGGILLAYIVPDRVTPVQKAFKPVNNILKAVHGVFASDTEAAPAKQDIYRSDYRSAQYLPALRGQPVEEIRVVGMYPLPMVSHSPEFPFSLMSPVSEKLLSAAFEVALTARGAVTKHDPWVCGERNGQAFLITCKKF